MTNNETRVSEFLWMSLLFRDPSYFRQNSLGPERKAHSQKPSDTCLIICHKEEVPPTVLATFRTHIPDHLLVSTNIFTVCTLEPSWTQYNSSITRKYYTLLFLTEFKTYSYRCFLNLKRASACYDWFVCRGITPHEEGYDGGIMIFLIFASMSRRDYCPSYIIILA